ncbi:alpha/beta hydrolase [Streptomyces sp. NPDC017638]|uniref:alpha/beta hydrolase n=1 Tax=Streptomyces sp. NPDC017638 TaxID=3365004 RepID=UPI00378BEFEE
MVFIHGAWLHASSWEPWAERFARRGFLTFTPGWPGEAPTARAVRASPEWLGDTGLEELTGHYASFVRSFETPPVIVGHSVGGLIAQHLIGMGLGQAAVAMAPSPLNGIAIPDSGDRPWRPAANDSGDGPVSLSPEQFRRLYANTGTAEEAGALFDRYVVPVSRRVLTDLTATDPNCHPRAVVDVDNADRGPLLLISGQEDQLVPDSATRAVCKLYGDSTAVTDLKQFADRGHSLTVDNGWRRVADHVLSWLDEQGVPPFQEEAEPALPIRAARNG